MQTFVYPSSTELMEIDQNLLPVLDQVDPIFRIFPVRSHDAAMVMWEQEDDYLGLTQIRGYEGEFPVVPGTGLKRYSIEPGVYGEHDRVSELEITTRRGYGQLGTPIDISDIVRRRHAKLATRQFNRMSQIMWSLLAKGIYYVNGPTGALVKWDSYVPQTYAAGVAWSTTATAAPLADLRAVTLLHRGASVTFGGSATAFMNLKTFNSMIANSNTNDLGGRRAAGLATIEGLGEFNVLMTKDNLPQVVVWDEGYKSDGGDGLTSGTWYPFIPDNTVVLIGRRLNGAALGEFQLTRNASNPEVGAQVMVRVVDKGARQDEEPPRVIKVFRGFNGGPSIHYPSSIVVMSV